MDKIGFQPPRTGRVEVPLPVDPLQNPYNAPLLPITMEDLKALAGTQKKRLNWTYLVLGFTLAIGGVVTVSSSLVAMLPFGVGIAILAYEWGRTE